MCNKPIAGPTETTQSIGILLDELVWALLVRGHLRRQLTLWTPGILYTMSKTSGWWLSYLPKGKGDRAGLPPAVPDQYQTCPSSVSPVLLSLLPSLNGLTQPDYSIWYYTICLPHPCPGKESTLWLWMWTLPFGEEATPTLEEVAPLRPYPLLLPEPWDGLNGRKERSKEPRWKIQHEIKEGRAPDKGKVDVYMGCRKQRPALSWPTAGWWDQPSPVRMLGAISSLPDPG